MTTECDARRSLDEDCRSLRPLDEQWIHSSVYQYSTESDFDGISREREFNLTKETF